MNGFVYEAPTKFVFGRGVTDQAGSELRALGLRRALVVYGEGSAVRFGTLQRVLDSLDSQAVEHVELGGVRPNPEVGLVREGIDSARRSRADTILAVGGGSAIDTAKAIALGVPYEGDVWDLFMKKGKPTSLGKPAVAAILTMPGAGSEGSDSAVISNDAIAAKRGLSCPENRPDLALMDPELTFTLPAWQTAAGVTDMCSHVLERYFSSAGPAPITDQVDCGIIRSLIECAPIALDRPTDWNARASIMWAGTLAHNGLAGLGRSAVEGKRAGGWECHALEHELSAHDPRITHGAGLAVLTPAWMRYVWKACPERFLSFGRDVFGIEPVGPEDGIDIAPEEAIRDAVSATISELQDFFVSLGMPRTLHELGVAADDIPQLLVTLEQCRGPRFGDLVPLTIDDARRIYHAAL